MFLLRNRPTTGGNVGRLTSGDTPTTHHAWLFALICRRVREGSLSAPVPERTTDFAAPGASFVPLAWVPGRLQNRV